jgi:hypothetical protein
MKNFFLIVLIGPIIFIFYFLFFYVIYNVNEKKKTEIVIGDDKIIIEKYSSGLPVATVENLVLIKKIKKIKKI